MITRNQGDLRPRLTRVWRRVLVVTASTCAAMIALLHLTQHMASSFRYSSTIGLGAVVLACLWLLVDTLLPWVGGEAVLPEERAHADTALRRGYEFLFGVALAVLLYLHAADSRPDLLPAGPHHGTVILWSLVTLVVLTPVAISAWTDVGDGSRTRQVGPIGLLRTRFGGRSRGVYVGGVAILLAAVPLAALGTASGGDGGPVETTIVVLALGIVAAVSAILLRIAMRERRRAGHERR